MRRGTLAAAAEALGYTPGAVSQHIAALERALGVALTERSGRMLILTDAGRVLARHAEALLDAEAGAVLAVRSARNTIEGSLTVGTWGSSARLLSPVVKRMAARYPEIHLRSREIDVDEAVTAVQYGDVDVAFGLDYDDAPMARDAAVSIVPLHEERFSITVAASPAAQRARTASIGELAALDWIMPPETSHYGRAVRYGCRRRGFDPKVVHEVTDTAASLQLAADGAGATPSTALMRRLNPSLLFTRLEMEDPLRRQIILATRSTGNQRPSLRVFTEVVQGVVRDLLGASEA